MSFLTWGWRELTIDECFEFDYNINWRWAEWALSIWRFDFVFKIACLGRRGDEEEGEAAEEA